MSSKRSVFAPVVVLVAAVLSGGWLLQEGVEQEQNVYLQARLFQEVVDRVEGQYVEDIGEAVLYERAIDGLIDGLDDPNSSFIEASEYEPLRMRTEGDYGGVGLEISQQGDYVTVTTPMPGTPGARAGLRAGDRFFTIGGEDAEKWSVDQAADRLRGEPGSTIEVEVLRPGVETPISFTLTREEIQIPAVPFGALVEGGVGYLPLSLFQESAAAEIRTTIDSLLSAGAGRLVLDLRGNPGGLLDQGVAVADLFLDEGREIVQTRGRAVGQSRAFRAESPSMYAGIPLVVLVDHTSASAAEIVAGALQDHDRALIVGNTSFGKGSVQSLFELTGGNVLRLTTARWYTPVGRSIQMEQEDQVRRITQRGTRALDGQPTVRPDTADRPVFTTESGRTLYGGGGITPDVVVLPDTLSLAEQRAVQDLYRHGGRFFQATFDYAVQTVQERGLTASEVVVDDETLEGFLAFLEEEGIELDPGTVEDASRFVRYELGREMALQAGGERGEFEYVRGWDLQLAAALEALRGADTPAELLGRVAEDAVAPPASPESDAPGDGSRDD